jgi:tripartite ATP-independent transporter DctM subunit
MSGELFRATNSWFGHRRGGLAMATFAACGGFSAICGSSVATAATMGRVALPEMRRYGYAGSLSTGVIAAGGTLGILIPPSVVLALYGAITDQDIGRLFVAGFLPGILAVTMYMATVQMIAWINPALAPAGARAGWPERWRSLHGVWPIMLVFTLVVGGLYGGVFTPTEAAAMGAAITIIVAWVRRSLSRRDFVESLVETVRTTGALFTVLIGALLFGYFLAVTQSPQKLADLLTGLDIGRYGVLLILLAFYLIMGCIMESLSLVLLTVPIVFPTIVALGFDPIWFGVIIVMTVELGLITPPFGINVFVINSIAKDVELTAIFRGVAPFIATDVVRLGLLVAFPGIVMLLPRTM